jgi:O-acetyl-ADP-ribose deacetylase (regulator of RNase III)
VAMKNSLKRIAFPSISTGIYGYPVAKAAEVAVQAVSGFVRENHGAFDEIIFCGFDSLTESEYAKALNAIA